MAEDVLRSDELGVGRVTASDVVVSSSSTLNLLVNRIKERGCPGVLRGQ